MIMMPVLESKALKSIIIFELKHTSPSRLASCRSLPRTTVPKCHGLTLSGVGTDMQQDTYYSVNEVIVPECHHHRVFTEFRFVEFCRQTRRLRIRAFSRSIPAP